MEERNCLCDVILGIPKERIRVHLMGCPKDWYTEEYKKMKWYEKVFHKSPKKLYEGHFKS